MTEQEIRQGLAAMQRVQSLNPPASQEWQRASAVIHKLAKMLTGKELQDAKGGR